MKIRGERECTDCGTRWSYYETGSVSCPGCGALRSVGVDERTEHTDQQVSFDLTEVRNAIDTASRRDLARQCREEARAYVRQRGFVAGGALRSLDDTYLAACELRHAADAIARERRLDEREELYFLSLLEGADQGRRPPAEEIPATLRSARGIAVASAVREYRRDIRTWCEEAQLSEAQRRAFETLGEHVTRLRMLDGDVTPETADTVVEATRELGDGLRGDSEALSRAESMLDSLTLE